MMVSILRKCLLFLIAGVLLIQPVSVKSETKSTPSTAIDTVCRFGITSPRGSQGYDIASIGVGSYLDWGVTSNPSLPEGVEYIRVLRLRDDLYPQTLINLPAWVEANLGSVWIIGNEPDTTYSNQDALLPEVYADRYYELAVIIHHLDPSARIGFGSVVQPTPIRMRYLTRAWNHLVTDAGSYFAASKLIDFWTIHSFILNEKKYSWGTGIPPGFENDHADAIEITDFSDTYSIDIFEQRVIAFRTWMANVGQREKPLWITEYGSLFPPEDPPGGPDYVNVSNEDTRNFMLATFGFMLSASDDQTGLPADGDQLVQRWYWFSLNEYPYYFGGTLFDPRDGSTTIVGEAFIDYQSSIEQPDLFPESLSVVPKSYNPDRTLVNYRLDITINNNLFEDATCAQVWVYDGNPDEGGVLIAGPIPSSAVHSNFGNGLVSALWMGVQPLTQHTIYVVVEAIGVSDTNPDNNQANFSVYTELPKLHFLPVINH
jgi:hypothetical protein